jgi:glycosyltransferase involved in cell wall biosynthesis
MQSAPTVSIIIAAYNAAGTIGEALASIPPAISRSYEIIIIDDGSTDNTSAVVEAHALAPQYKIIRQANAGVSAARNAGIAEATGEYVFFFDADDVLCPRAIDRLLGLIENTPHIVLAYGNYVNTDERGNVLGIRHHLHHVPRPRGDVVDRLLQANFIVTGAALIRRSALQQAGGFNTALKFAEDWELWCRIALQGDFAWLRGEPVMQYRRHPQSSTAVYKDLVELSRPTVDAIFSNPAIIKRIEPLRLKHLYNMQLAHMTGIVAIREARAGRWGAAFRHYKSAIMLNPMQFLTISGRFLANSLRLI